MWVGDKVYPKGLTVSITRGELAELGQAGLAPDLQGTAKQEIITGFFDQGGTFMPVALGTEAQPPAPKKPSEWEKLVGKAGMAQPPQRITRI